MNVAKWLNQTLDNVEAVTGRTGSGKPIYGVIATGVPCRFQGKRSRVRNRQGEEVVTQAEVWTTYPIEETYRVTYQGHAYEVLAVEDVVGLDGQLSHKKVYV
jgi:hypothetical protein